MEKNIAMLPTTNKARMLNVARNERPMLCASKANEQIKLMVAWPSQNTTEVQNNFVEFCTT